MNLSGGIPAFRVRYEAEAVQVWGEEKGRSPHNLKGKKILAFCGLARPESFEETLRGLGAEILRFEPFPDHFSYREGDLESLMESARQAGAEALVTTEKDMVRLEGFSPGPVPLWALTVRHVFRGDDRSRFEAFLLGRLGLRS